MRTGTISVKEAYKLSVKIGKILVERGKSLETNGKKLNLEIVKDVFEKNLPRKFRPEITNDAKAFQQYCEKYGVLPEDPKKIHDFMFAITLPKQNAKRKFIYFPDEKGAGLNYIDTSALLGHELFHAIVGSKTKKGIEEMREVQKYFRKNLKFDSQTNKTKETVDVQDLLFKAFKINELEKPSQEVQNLYSRLESEGRCQAYTRSALRTIFDPRLKPGETKSISELSLPIEKSINPNGIVQRPETTQKMHENKQVAKISQRKRESARNVLKQNVYKDIDV